MFKQYQEVELTHEILSDDFAGDRMPLKEGQPGVVLEIYKRFGMPNGFDVEFFDSHFNTVAIMIVEEKDIQQRSEKTVGA